MLNASGGGENFSKSFYYVVEQIPEDGAWRTLTMEEHPDLRVIVHDWENGGSYRLLEGKEVMDVHHTLGYHLNLIDSNDKPITMVLNNTKKINYAVLKSHLRPRKKRLAYNTFVWPSITPTLRAGIMKL